MPKPRRRLTARDLMIALVAFALSLKLGLAYGLRSPAYWREARLKGEMADSFRFYAMRFDDLAHRPPGEDPAESRDAAIKARRFAADLDRERTRYYRAAFLPWLPTAPRLPDN